MTTVTIGLLALAVPKVVGYLNDRNRSLKVKSAMMATESAIRAKLSRIDSYDCSMVGGSLKCPIRAGVKLATHTRGSQQFQPVIGAECPTNLPGGCGILVTATPNAGRMEVVLSYEGQKLSLEKWKFRVDIPSHTDSELHCDHATPIFQGIDRYGKKICRALPPPCPAGQFVESYDPVNLAPTCTALPGRVRCADGQYLSLLDWSWEGVRGNRKLAVRHECRARWRP